MEAVISTQPYVKNISSYNFTKLEYFNISFDYYIEPLMSSCGIKNCSYYILLGAISGAMLYLILIIALVLYLANSNLQSSSNKLDNWRDKEIEKIESEYKKPEGFQGVQASGRVQSHAVPAIRTGG